MQPKDQYKKLLEDARNYFNSIDKIYCPALKGEVYFTSEGFHHLRYDNSLKERSKQERRNKLSSIPAAVETLKLSTTIQEYRTTLEPVGLKNKQGLRNTAKVNYFAFWAVIIDKQIRVKVIVKQVNSGQYNFWSVMPYWTEINNRKVFGSQKLSDE